MRPGHVGSMAASSADDHLTASAVLTGGDADVVVSDSVQTQFMLECTFYAFGPARIVDGRTQ